MKLLIECHNLYFLRDRTWLYIDFIIKINPKLNLLSLDIFGNSVYEKNGHLFKTVKICFVQKILLRLLTCNKKCKNRI